MTLRELLHFVMDRGSFTKTISFIHETDSRWHKDDVPIDKVFRSYTNAARELLELDGGCELDGYSIVIEGNVQDGEEFTDVYLSNGDDKWGTSFVDWDELIDLTVDDRTSVAIHEILAHVMYDITFHGFTRKSVIDAGEDLRSIPEGDTIVFDLSSFLDD